MPFSESTEPLIKNQLHQANHLQNIKLSPLENSYHPILCKKKNSLPPNNIPPTSHLKPNPLKNPPSFLFSPHQIFCELICFNNLYPLVISLPLFFLPAHPSLFFSTMSYLISTHLISSYLIYYFSKIQIQHNVVYNVNIS